VRRALLATVVVASVAVGALPAAGARASGKTAEARQYAVGALHRTFVDHSRPTDANGTAPALFDRTIPALVLYPARGEARGEPVDDAPVARKEAPYPLVVFSHGFTAKGPDYEARLLRGIAAAGYVVVAPTFPLTNRSAPGGARLVDYVNQPADVSFVIDEMLRLDRRPGRLRGTIDTDRVGVTGHSLGAITTLGLTYNACCTDDRIDAAVPISGLQLPFRDQPWTWPAVPLLLVHGDQDQTVPYDGSAAAYAAASPPKFLLTLVGAPHTPFTGAWQPVVTDTIVDFFDRYLEGERAALGRLEADGNVAGVATLQSDPR